MTVLSYLYGIIMDHTINVPGQENNVLYGINATYFFGSNKLNF